MGSRPTRNHSAQPQEKAGPLPLDSENTQSTGKHNRQTLKKDVGQVLDFGTYYITNAKWGTSICASANNNGEVYLQAPNDREYCKWQLFQDDVYPTYYYIMDIQRNKYLFSGYAYDAYGKVYEGDFDSSKGDHFRWKLEVIANSVFDPDNPQQGIIIQSLCLTDRAFGKAIIGGTDGRILFTDPDSTNVLASLWSFVLISV